MKIFEIINENSFKGQPIHISELESKIHQVFSKLKIIPGFLNTYNKIASNKQLIRDLMSDIKSTSGSKQKILALIQNRVATLATEDEPLDEGVASAINSFTNKLFDMLPGLFGLMILAVPFYGAGDAHQKWASIQTLVIVATVLSLISKFKNKSKKKSAMAKYEWHTKAATMTADPEEKANHLKLAKQYFNAAKPSEITEAHVDDEAGHQAISKVNQLTRKH
jgi:hypothetical protein